MSNPCKATVTGASPQNTSPFWLTVILAGLILMITMGIRQTVIVHATTISVVELSMGLVSGYNLGAFCRRSESSYPGRKAKKKHSITMQ